MSGACPEPTEVLAHLGLPADDPRRTHLDSCARCQAIAANYREFLEPGGAVATADLRDADRRLEAAVEREDGPPPLPAEPAAAGNPNLAAPASSAPAGRRAAARPRSGRLQGGAVPVRWRWAAALGAVAVVALVVVLQAPSPRMGPTVLREQSATGAGAKAAAPVLAIPRTVPGQGVELRWEPVNGADGYTVVLYSVALEELTRVGTLKQPQLLLTRELVPATVVTGTPVLLRVVALRQGAVLSTSRAASVLTPP